MSYDEAVSLLNSQNSRTPNAKTAQSLIEARAEFPTARRYDNLDEMMKDIAEFEE